LTARRRWPGPRRITATIALVFSACLLVISALPADAAALDMRGSWTLDVKVGSNPSMQTLEVVSMDLGSGAFRGTLIFSAQKASVTGTVSGSKVRFESTPATGSASSWTGDVSGNGVALTMSGSVTPAQGQGGTFRGSRITAAVPLATGAPASGRPPLPPSARELSPGQLPRQCTVGEVGVQGYYFSSTAKHWVSAPFCYLRWGNLEASGSQIVAAGAKVTVTAIPTDGSNSATYAPQTQSIHWTYPGQAVSGCGAADLTCTAIPAKVASSEWQWLEFHVTMPRTFFIDSPGDLCGGQHLCAGATTNAWSYVGIAPAGTAPGAAGAAQAPGVFGGSGPAGGQGTGAGGGGGAPVGLIVGVAAVLAAGAVGATVVTASRNPMGASAQVLGRVGSLLSRTPGPSGKGAAGKGGGSPGKAGGMSQIDAAALGQQLQQMTQSVHAQSAPPAPPPADATPGGDASPPPPTPEVTPTPPG
jgi:hypothetical protein